MTPIYNALKEEWLEIQRARQTESFRKAGSAVAQAYLQLLNNMNAFSEGVNGCKNEAQKTKR